MSDATNEATGAITPLRAALRNRCQNCGLSPLSQGFLGVVERCEACGADYRRHAAGDGAVYVVLTALCIVVMASVIAVEFAYRPPVWVHVTVGVAMTCGLAFLLLPPVKRFMVAQSFAMDARGEGWADPETDEEAQDR